MSKRVLLLSWEYPPVIEGGLARHVRKLAEALVRQGVSVDVLTRGVGDGPQTGQPGVDELVSYESKLNRFLPRYPQVILCLYDLNRFTGEILLDLLKTHPKVLLGGMLVANPYYLDPDEFLVQRQ